MIIKCLSCFGFCKKSLVKFAKAYPTFQMIFEKLQEYKGYSRKRKLLERLLQESGTEDQAIECMINLMFMKSYDNEYVKDCE